MHPPDYQDDGNLLEGLPAGIDPKAAAAIFLRDMPAFWRDRFAAIVRQHGQTRKGRRAVAALSRRYASWKRGLERLLRRRAEEKALKIFSRRVRNAKRAERGLPPLRKDAK